MSSVKDQEKKGKWEEDWKALRIYIHCKVEYSCKSLDGTIATRKDLINCKYYPDKETNKAQIGF